VSREAIEKWLADSGAKRQVNTSGIWWNLNGQTIHVGLKFMDVHNAKISAWSNLHIEFTSIEIDCSGSLCGPGWRIEKNA
jgi:hypothetical protein